ncbi:PREDICTED: uncharacterized protein LOC109180361 isoform X1 [Ipomoea nil]|uniref:uncharacterized protein LOC109180361 isoform X1 n=1 Tax=Ipomoea nil TaxID=35883 RepID=UPI000900D10E|nr:PREDICTED: uncharacterized protein LOC109180361 isoform X1 [Ipomoea nil]
MLQQFSHPNVVHYLGSYQGELEKSTFGCELGHLPKILTYSSTGLLIRLTENSPFLTGSAHMTWKERKDLENKKVVSLGGKPPKKQRLPLSVARVMMKKQKEREQKELEESLILRRFGVNYGSSSRRVA